MGPGRFKRAIKAWRRAPEVVACATRLVEWRRVTLAYLGIRAAEYPFTAHFRSGDRVHIETYHDLATLWVIFFRQEYRVQSHFRTIVDAGANIGTFALYAARMAPNATIHALEPFPSTRERLARTIRENGLESRVKIYATGLSGTNDPRYMSPAGPSQSRGTTADAGPEKVRVETLTLEMFMETANVPEGAMLKMDIEGAEHEVLPAASPESLRRFSQIALEYHPNGSRASLFTKLMASGFVCALDRRDHEDSGVAQFVQPAN